MLYTTLSTWAPSVFFHFRNGFQGSVLNSLAVTYACWFLRIPESVSRFLLVVVFVTLLYHQKHLQRFARTVVAKYARDAPMTERETMILREAPWPIAYVAGVVTGALIGKTAWYVHLSYSRRLISAVYGLVWSQLYLLAPIIGITLLGLWGVPQKIALSLLSNVLSICHVVTSIFFRGCGATTSKTRAWMLSTLIRERINGKDTVNSKFRYPFITENRQIRLLKLERSGVWIKATLISTHLDVAPPFEAISYTWGDPAATHQLLIDGDALPMTRNAASVISYLASPWRPRLLWLDTVCVDQSSNTDKATQVKTMPAIYAKASRVIIWLGDAPDAHIAFDFIQELRLWQTIGPPDDERLFDSVRQAPDDHPMYCSLRRLLNNPYWGRVWIVQEVVLARVVHINYGGRWIDWTLFTGVVEALLQNEKGCLWEIIALVEGLAVLPVHGLQKVMAIAEARQQFMQKRLSLPKVLARFAESKATIAIDRVFALQGISTPANALAVDPDYSMSELDVFEAATVHAFGSDKPFLLPSIACEARRATKSEPLNQFWPSWVPDLERLSDRHGIYALCENSFYNACGDRSLIRLTYQERNHIILLHGFRLDSIRVVAVQKPDYTYTIAEIDELADSASKVQQMTASFITSGVARHDEALQIAEWGCSDVYFNGELRKDAFWRTLFGNTSRTSYPAETEWGERYEELIRLWRNILSTQSKDPGQAREGTFEALNLPETVREELRNPEGYGQGSPEDLINTLEKLLSEVPGVEVRRHLTPALLADRARLVEEIIAAVELSQGATDELRALVRDGKINHPDMDLSSIASSTWAELHRNAFGTMPTTKDYLAAHQRMCLVLAFIYSIAGMSALSDEKIAAFQTSGAATIKLERDLIQLQYLLSPLAITFWSRQFAVTETGLLALVPPETQPHDIVCVFEGATTPHVLQKADVGGDGSGKQRWRLLGEAYVHGYMEGQIVARTEKKEEVFQIC